MIPIGGLAKGFHLSPLAAFPFVVAAIISVCGMAVWLFIAYGGSQWSPSPSHVVAESASPTAAATATRTPRPATATPTPTPEAPLEAAGADSSAATHDSAGPAADSGMRMVIPNIGVNAPVTIRVMGNDGVMGPPNGRFDVVWYDFSAFAGMGGYPGSGGNAVFSGHVDYHPHYTAVFWDLGLLGPGDIIEVYLPDGVIVRYSVQWSEQISPSTDFASYCTATGEETITIVTCQGTFDATTRQYSHRLVVRGVRIE